VAHLITLLNPSVKKVGILYEPSEQNAASLVEVPEAENALRAQGIDVVKEAVRTRDEIADRVNRLVVAQVDFVVIPTNRLLYSNVPEIRAVTDASGVPIVSFARQGVKAGAMIGITSNNRLLGSKVAEMLVRILEEHSAPSERDWYFPEKYSILLNEESRARLGFRVPRKIQRIATIIDPAGE
jgi:putative ABC transport system substrate-binding protein